LAIRFTVDGKLVSVNAPESTPLLGFLPERVAKAVA
jgi:hypothetical protein